MLKHRENTNGQTRIIAFVGSPLEDDPRLKKRYTVVMRDVRRLVLLLTKDAIAVDILSFGEMQQNHEILSDFISKVNIDNNSHLYEVSSFQSFNDVLIPGGENGIAVLVV